MNPNTTTEICGTTTVLNPDPGRSFPSPIRPTCEAPEVVIDGETTIVYIDSEPQAVET
ncbi:hypothetical protein [Thiocapsa sp. N5-Cardenillas]|uniref:hypothetical protein n=1 Tax=Thiocapsa sp. N5-Cardenillas TaxID=3137397 RepID=UPI0035B0E29C